MADNSNDQTGQDTGPTAPSADAQASDSALLGAGARPGRRHVLMMGAAAASTVVTVRPALAQTAGSVMNCEIPIPDPGRMGNYIAPDGSVVPPGTPGAFPPPGRNLVGEQVKGAIQHGSPIPGYGYEQSQAYTNYIRRLQSGMSGFTCYASIQTTTRG